MKFLIAHNNVQPRKVRDIIWKHNVQHIIVEQADKIIFNANLKARCIGNGYYYWWVSGVEDKERCENKFVALEMNAHGDGAQA
jgi:hypothetical protein